MLPHRGHGRHDHRRLPRGQERGQTLILAAFGAFALRAALAPFSLHTDILYIQFFPSFLGYGVVWDVYGHFGGRFVLPHDGGPGFTYYQPAIYFVTAFFQRLTAPFNPGFQPFIAQVEGLMEMHRYKAHWEITEFLGRYRPEEIRRFAACMKLSYFVADAACVWALVRTVRGAEDRRRALVGWLFHPVNLFSTYVFGQYRIWSALGTWLAAWAGQTGRRTWVFLALGVTALFDLFPFLLLAPALLVFGRDAKERAKFLVFFALPLAAVLVPFLWHSGKWVLYSYGSEVIQRTVTQSITRSFWRTAVAWSTKLALAAAYGALLVSLWKRRPAAGAAGKLFAHASLATLLLVYATTGTMVHYFLWALPLWVWMNAEGPPWPRALSAAYIGLLFLFNLDTREMNLGLLAPLDLRLASAPSLHETMDRFLPWGTVVAGARFLFSALSAFFAWRLWTERVRPLFSRS